MFGIGDLGYDCPQLFLFYVDKVADSLSLVATVRNSFYINNESGGLGSVSWFRGGENGIGLRRIRNSIYINT